jgi:hypothetical protein
MNSSDESEGTLVYRERCRLLKECADAAEGGSKLIGVLAWIIHDFASKKRKGALKD